MVLQRRIWILLAAALAVAFASTFGTFASVGESAAKVKSRTIYLSAVEWKGGTNVSKEPFPTAPLLPGGGYELVPPDAKGDWSTETYRFDSAVVVAYVGERVTLKIFGVNAAYHDITMPNFNRNFRVSRGQLSTVRFVTKKAGIYPIICVTHMPSHRADLVVLPRPS